MVAPGLYGFGFKPANWSAVPGQVPQVTLLPRTKTYICAITRTTLPAALAFDQRIPMTAEPAANKTKVGGRQNSSPPQTGFMRSKTPFSQFNFCAELHHLGSGYQEVIRRPDSIARHESVEAARVEATGVDTDRASTASRPTAKAMSRQRVRPAAPLVEVWWAEETHQMGQVLKERGPMFWKPRRP